MEQKYIRPEIKQDLKMEAFIKSSINMSDINGENKNWNDLSPRKQRTVPFNKHQRFRDKLSESVEMNLPAKELSCLIVRAALETEYGLSFTKNANFDKMVDKIAESVMVNPILRKQALAAVSEILTEKMSSGKRN